MKIKNLSLVGIILIMIATCAFSATAQSSQAVDYGLVKFISGGNEYKMDESYKFEFSGNIIYEYVPTMS